MKKSLLILSLMAFLVSACGGKSSNSKKFEPKDRTTSKLSDSERKAAIEAKRNELNINMDVALNGNDVKLSVMPPLPQGDITEEVSEKIALKMLGVLTANGIGGVNNVPGFALCASMGLDDKKVTSTVPQKMLVGYTLTYSVRNLNSGDVYATQEEKITGVGESFEEATSNAVKEIKNSPALQKMLNTASEKIIKWFNENLPTFKRDVDRAIADNNYALALAYLESVPQKAEEAYKYVGTLHDKVLEKFQKQNASRELAAVKEAITAANGEMSTEVFAHLQMLPADSPEYKEASKLCEEYEKRCIDKQESDSNRAHEKEMALIEADRLKAQYQAQATEQAMRKHLREQDYERRGFWGSLGEKLIKMMN